MVTLSAKLWLSVAWPRRTRTCTYGSFSPSPSPPHLSTAATALLLFFDDTLTCVHDATSEISPKLGKIRNPRNCGKRLQSENLRDEVTNLLLSLLPLDALRVHVLDGRIRYVATALGRARVWIGLRRLTLHLQRRRRVSCGEHGESGGVVGKKGQILAQRMVFRIADVARRRVEEIDGLRGRQLEKRGEGAGGFRRRSHESLDFFVELKRVECGLLHDWTELNRTEPGSNLKSFGLLKSLKGRKRKESDEER